MYPVKIIQRARMTNLLLEGRRFSNLQSTVHPIPTPLEPASPPEGQTSAHAVRSNSPEASRGIEVVPSAMHALKHQQQQQQLHGRADDTTPAYLQRGLAAQVVFFTSAFNQVSNCSIAVQFNTYIFLRFHYVPYRMASVPTRS
jgi:hypothetical protein